MRRHLLLICLLAVVLAHQALAAARGGSSSRSSSSSSRSSSSRSSSSRSSSSSSRSSRSYSARTGGTSYSTMSKFVSQGFSWSVKYRAFRSGYYLSSWTWRQSHSDPSSDTPICFNFKDSLPAEFNSSVRVAWIYQNRTTYGIFVCPLDGQAGKIYCCGDDGAEWCCTFWDDGGRVAGVVIGIICGLVFLCIIVYVAVKCTKGAASASSSVSAVKSGNIPPPPYPGGINYDNYYQGGDQTGMELQVPEPPQYTK